MYGNWDPRTPFEETSDDVGLIDLFVALNDDADNFAGDVALGAATGFYLLGARGDAFGNICVRAPVQSRSC